MPTLFIYGTRKRMRFPVWKSNFAVHLSTAHHIDATPALRRGGVDFSGAARRSQYGRVIVEK